MQVGIYVTWASHVANAFASRGKIINIPWYVVGSVSWIRDTTLCIVVLMSA